MPVLPNRLLLPTLIGCLLLPLGPAPGPAPAAAASPAGSALPIADDVGRASDAPAADAVVTPPAGFRYIPSGTFTMGSPEDELGRGSEEIRHTVTLTRGFLLAEHPVTAAQWADVMGGRSGSRRPVVGVSWIEAVAFCNALSRREGLQPAYKGSGVNWVWIQEADGYRLPTEAEWEYACRAGSLAALAYGPLTAAGCDDPLLDRLGWYCGNSEGELQEVGLKVANAWGLHDMHGNVWEWCWDRSGSYPQRAAVDPVGPSFGARRILRGGSFRDAAASCRCAQRLAFVPPDLQDDNVGFRLARSVAP